LVFGHLVGGAPLRVACALWQRGLLEGLCPIKIQGIRAPFLGVFAGIRGADQEKRELPISADESAIEDAGDLLLESDGVATDEEPFAFAAVREQGQEDGLQVMLDGGVTDVCSNVACSSKEI